MVESQHCTLEVQAAPLASHDELNNALRPLAQLKSALLSLKPYALAITWSVVLHCPSVNSS